MRHAKDLQLPTPARAEVVARAELRAFLRLLRQLDDADWQRWTDNEGWDVRDVAAHVLRACQESASPATLVGDSLRAFAHLPMALVDALNEVGVHAGRRREPAELVADLERIGPKALRARRDFPRLLRAVPLPIAPVHATVGRLMDVVYPRDMFIHRIDISRATGREMTFGEHEPLLVEQVVRDLHERWLGPPATLELTGPAGGAWVIGTGEPTGTITVDAIAYVRTLSGRDDDPPLKADPPSLREAAVTAHIPV